MPYRRPFPIRIIRRLTRHPLAVTSVLSFGMRMGKDTKSLRQGEIDRHEFNARAGANIGGVSLGAAGTKVGALAGSAFPGIGTIVGAFAGMAIGEAAGNRLGRVAAEAIDQRVSGKTRDPDLEPPKRSM